ncbi:MAG: hypothetical protein WKF84_27900 [Pyrinomonadaceae bacterium]
MGANWEQARSLIVRRRSRAVVEAINSGSKLFLIGPRRYGKTSILRAAAEQSEASGAVVLSYNVEAYPTLDSARAGGFD